MCHFHQDVIFILFLKRISPQKKEMWKSNAWYSWASQSGRDTKVGYIGYQIDPKLIWWHGCCPIALLSPKQTAPSSIIHLPCPMQTLSLFLLLRKKFFGLWCTCILWVLSKATVWCFLMKEGFFKNMLSQWAEVGGVWWIQALAALGRQ